MAVIPTLARLRREPLGGDLLTPGLVDQLCRTCGHVWRDRVFTPVVTLRLFLLQVLHGNTSIAHVRQLAGLCFAPGSYCAARERLPLAAIAGLLDALRGWAGQYVQCDATTRPGSPPPRVLIADGTSFSTHDTAELRAHFGIYPGAKPGVSYPMGRLLGLLDAASGLFVQLLAAPLLSHEAGQVTRIHPMLRAGDILLGDRAFCSFVHVALLNARGVLACFRLHQQRKVDRGGGARRQRWPKPPKPPVWMDAVQFALLPAWIEVRLVSYPVARPGFRTVHVIVATTLSEQHWTDADVAALYGRRWEIETCFDHLKTTMGMNMLKCKSVPGVMKELAVYLLAYNLVRLAMLKAAARQGVAVNRVSFIDATRWLLCRMLGLAAADKLIVNPDRHGRCQLRVIRGRMKAYDLLVRPRGAMNAPGKSGRNA